MRPFRNDPDLALKTWMSPSSLLQRAPREPYGIVMQRSLSAVLRKCKLRSKNEAHLSILQVAMQTQNQLP